MGRKRKSVGKKTKKRLPKVYHCPKCGIKGLNVLYVEKEGVNRVICVKCGLTKDYEYNVHHEKIDVYCMFIDEHYGQ